MVYRGTIKQDANVKVIIATVVSLLALITMTVYGFKVLFINNGNNRSYNSLLYAQVINDSMPVVKVTAFEEEALAEQNVTIKGEVLKLLGINIYNPISIVCREIPYFGSMIDKASGIGQADGDNAYSISPFSLSQGQINGSNNAGNSSNTSSSGDPDKVIAVKDPDLKQNLDVKKPRVLIYHTHTTEAFSPNGNYNSENGKNISDVGAALKTELESAYGISVIHDKTVHNTDFNKSYSKSRATVEKYINQYGDFDLIIDMHRDAVYSKSSVTTKMNGESVSKIMFVLTKKNPHFSKNQAVVNELIKISNKHFPGFCRGMYFYNYGSKYFNQDKSNNAILIEVGANVSTHQEAKNSAKYTARIIAEYLKDHK